MQPTCRQKQRRAADALIRWADTHMSDRMNDQEINQKPEVLEAIRKDTERLGFTMASEPKTGAF